MKSSDALDLLFTRIWIVGRPIENGLPTRTYRTTPEMQHGRRTGRVMRSFRKQAADAPT